MFVLMQIAGLDEVLRDVGKLQQNLRNKIVKRALRAVAKPFIDDAKALAPKDTKALTFSLGQVVRQYGGGRVTFMAIGPRRGKGFERVKRYPARTGSKGKTIKERKVLRRPVRYAHMMEKGTKHLRPRPFLHPAWMKNKGKIDQKLASLIWDQVRLAVANINPRTFRSGY